jgi:hypothetical protein
MSAMTEPLNAAEASAVAAVEPFAHFLSATGHRVLRGAGAYWYDPSPGFFLALPSHRLLQPADDELRALFRHQPCAGLRFAAPLDGPGKLSYQIVCDARDYDLEQLSANIRSKVRRGLRRCEIAPVSCATIAADGLAADRETLARQQRAVRLEGPAWDNYWRAAAGTETMEGWGAYVGGSLAAFLVSVRLDDSVEFLLARSRSDALDAYPNNALVYEVARRMLVERGVRQITFGLESLEDVEALDQFKFGMGFRRAPLRQRVVFHPVLRRILNATGARAALRHWADGRGQRGGFWHKALGLLRFAEEGGDLRGASRWAA